MLSLYITYHVQQLQFRNIDAIYEAYIVEDL